MTMTSGTYYVYLVGDGKSFDATKADASFTYEAGYTLGDVSGDGDITTTDALMVLQSIVNNIKLTETQKLAADVSKSDGITTTDALMILQYIVRNITEF